MSDRTNQFFTIPLVNAIVVAWIDPIREGEFIGDQSWYQDGRVIWETQKDIRIWKDGYKTRYLKKGYKYHNITNKPAQLNHFIEKVAKKLAGAQSVDFYDSKARRPAKPIETRLL